ncbi:phosphatase PAP2 family protein [bacterium]|jgi:membrane-associated phospholipid phosphatase|nr:phosphatase PAP2 family protein [bacterium]
MNKINSMTQGFFKIYICIFLSLISFSTLKATNSQFPLTSIDYYKNLTLFGVETTLSPLSWTENEWKSTSLIIGAGLIGYMVETDIKNWINDQNSDLISNIGKIGDSIGSPYFLLPLTASMAGYGFLSSNSKLTKTSIHAFSAGLITGGLTKGMKALFNRHRPSSGDDHNMFDGPSLSGDEESQSFPSGHSSVTWAIATIFAENYKNNSIIYYGAYGFSTFVSISRSFHNEHWISDIIIGSALGHFVAKSVLADYKISKSIKFSPILTSSAVGGKLNF